jgi:hypothetical protein
VIETVRLIPPPLTVIVAVRDALPLLAVAVTVMVPLFEPDAAETVAHDAVLLTVHVTLDETVIACAPPFAAKSSEDGETDSVGAGAGVPACVILTVRLMLLPLTVIVAVRDALPLLAVVVMVIVPLSEPDVAETVAHDAVLLTVHATLDETVIDCAPPVATKFSDDGETDSVGAGAGVPACVMSTVRLILLPLTVIVAVRDALPLLAVVVTVMVAFPLPEAAETVAHESVLLTVHATLDEMSNVCAPPFAVKFSEDGETDRDGAGGGVSACVMLTVRLILLPLTVIVAVRDALPR